MPSNTAVKTLVSPTLHPANIESLEGYEAAKQYVAHSVTALDSAYQAVEHVMEARKKLQLDESRTKKAQVLMAAQLSEKYLDSLQKTFESSWARLDSGIKHIEAELSKPLEEFAGIGNVATEIRAHFKTMSQGERRKLIAEALEVGDEKTIKSICGAPAYLSGINEVEQQHTIRNFHMKTNPVISQRLIVMKSAKGKLEQAKPIVFTEMEKALGVTRIELAKLKASNSEAEAVLIIKEFAPSPD